MSDFAPQTTVVPDSGDYRWLRANWGRDVQVPATIDVALLKDENGAFLDGVVDTNTGIIPAGLPLGKVTETGKYGPYDATATDGRDVLAGFLSAPEQLQGTTFAGVTSTELEVGLLVVGLIDPTYVPTTPTLDGSTKRAGNTVLLFWGIDYTEGGDGSYTLPAATSSALGGVKQGAAVTKAATDGDASAAITAVNSLIDSLKAAGTIA
jgi:hypothetical protein